MGRQNGSRNWKDRVQLPIIIHIGKGEIRGNWIKANCTICQRDLIYWSRSSEPLERYKFPVCQECK